jgi:hypothetical protein
MTLKELAIKHSYYCHPSNYYNNNCSHYFDTWDKFFEEWADADKDMNLVFRWDILEKEDENEKGTGTYEMQVFIMGQRKGLYQSCTIHTVTEADVPAIVNYLKGYKDHLMAMWEPIN